MAIAPFAAPVAPAPSLWQLGIESQDLQRDIEALALQLADDDDDAREDVIAQLEALLAAEADQQQALERKADAYCWVIDNLRAQAAYRKQQADRLTALAAADNLRAQRLQESLLTVLTRLQPEAVKFDLQNHVISSRRSEAVVIDDVELLPPELLRIKTTTDPDKTAIKAALKAGEVPGARLEQRRSWAIK